MMKKQFFRVKQLADQTFLKADKSEVLNHEELQIADQKVEYLRTAITAISKRIPAPGQGSDLEKRAKKCMEYHLASVFFEQSARKNEQSAPQEDECHLFQQILRDCGHVEQSLAREYVEHELKVEEMVSLPFQTLLENDFPNILKHKRNLSKYILDKDSASNRYHSTKKEALKDNMEEADSKVEQTRDMLAYEMFNLLAKENELSSYILQLLKLQRGYHESALKNLENVIPELERKIGDSHVKRVFGISLQEHLRVTGKRLALPLEICITVLSKIGMSEEGLFRIAGGMSRVKRLKSSLDSGCLACLIPEYQDVHVLASTLKMYLRELPEPLLTYHLHNDWMQSMQYPENQRLDIVRQLLWKLPQENYDNLSFLMQFLAKLTQFPENKMTSSNIAIVIAPNLLWEKNEEMNMGNCATINMLIELFIKEVNELFPRDLSNFVQFPFNLHESDESKGDQPVDLNVSYENIPVMDSPRPSTRKKKPAAPVPPLNHTAKEEADRIPPAYPSGSVTLRPAKTKDKKSIGTNTEEKTEDQHKNLVNEEKAQNCDVYKTTVTHQIRSPDAKPVASPRTLIPKDDKIARTPSLRNDMTKSVDFDAIQLRNKPEVPARPASLQKRSSDVIDPGQLHKTQCSMYSVAHKQQPSIVNLAREKHQLGHDNQIAEKERFLGHQPDKSKLELKLKSENEQNECNRKPSHVRTRSDGNVIDFKGPVCLQQTPPSPRVISKPTEPPPPPPVKSKEIDSTDL